MTNCKMLEEVMKTSGYTLQYIAERLGITTAALYNERKGLREFTVEEMKILCSVLNISNPKREEIFLS